jgi:micrococcal nuclease
MRMHAFAMRRFFLVGIAVLLPLSLSDAHPGQVNRKGCHFDKAANERHCHPERATLPAETRVSPKPGDEGVFDGPLLWVSDGDTLRVLVRGREMEVRLADIDAPERDQAHGWQSKLQLIDLVRGKHIVLAPRDVDQYGRIVAHVWVGDIDINRELVKRGSAWFYPEYAESDALYEEEQSARTAKTGLWALPASERVEPWEWRRRARESHERARAGRRRSGE